MDGCFFFCLLQHCTLLAYLITYDQLIVLPNDAGPFSTVDKHSKTKWHKQEREKYAFTVKQMAVQQTCISSDQHWYECSTRENCSFLLLFLLMPQSTDNVVRPVTSLGDVKPLNPTATLHTQGSREWTRPQKKQTITSWSTSRQTLTFRTDYVTTCSRVSKAELYSKLHSQWKKGSIEFHWQVYPHF